MSHTRLNPTANWFVSATSRFIVSLIALCLAWTSSGPQAQAQFGDGLPIEINAGGETRFEGGIAIAERDVSIELGETSIFADRAEFNPSTRELVLIGNVRVYSDEQLFVGDSALYNIDTKALEAGALEGGSAPFWFSAEKLDTEDSEEFKAFDANITTHDSSKPDSYWRARRVRIYPDDRVVMSNVTWYVGKVPIFWFPYLYQSLDEDNAITFSPGYSDVDGMYLYTRYTLPVTDNTSATIALDLRSERGIGGGADFNFRYGQENRSKGVLRIYALNDSDPTASGGSLAERMELDTTRYRIGLQHKAFINDDLTASFNITVLSDRFITEDFFRDEFRLDPVPDNVIALTQYNENWTLTATARAQLNDFHETTERLPEVAFDIKRQPLFDSGVFYEGEASVAAFERRFGSRSDLPDYSTTRLDTFHQFTAPQTLFGFLSVVPRAGFRFTHYDKSGFIEDIASLGITEAEMLAEDFVPPVPTLINRGSQSRTVFNLGLETSFKVSNTWDHVQSRRLGLDGLRHVVQPYSNLSYVSDPGVDPEEILQFDRLIPSTQLNPIDFPQFTTIDSLDKWTIWRFGVRQAFQTRRGDSTFDWLTLDTYFDVNIDNPYDDSDFSNVFNRLRWSPVPWVTLNMDSQLPLLATGFTEVNTSLNFMPWDDMQLSIGHRYLDGNPFFRDSNLATLGIYYRINDNWAFSIYEQYEFDDSTLETQSYTLHRDLSSWVASLGAVVREVGGEQEFAVLLTFTLKDLPQVSFPIGVDNTEGSDGLSGFRY